MIVEILFRAKRIDNHCWETGALMYQRQGTSEEKFFIEDTMTMYHIPVIPETLCRYTGYNDVNGKRVFEGDILCFDENVKAYGIVRYGEYCEDRDAKEQYNNHVGFWIEHLFYKNEHHKNLLWLLEGSKVVGNIYDNQELLVEKV